jgi:hypothetical protein
MMRMRGMLMAYLNVLSSNCFLDNQVGALSIHHLALQEVLVVMVDIDS